MTNNQQQIPRIGVGGLIINQNKVLLVKRAAPPAKGLWALPGGKLQWGETLEQAVEREVLEETGLTVKAKEIIYTFNHITHNKNGEIQFHYVIIDLLAHPCHPHTTPIPGDDAADARWLTLADLKTLPVSKPTLKLIKKYIIV